MVQDSIAVDAYGAADIQVAPSGTGPLEICLGGGQDLAIFLAWINHPRQQDSHLLWCRRHAGGPARDGTPRDLPRGGSRPSNFLGRHKSFQTAGHKGRVKKIQRYCEGTTMEL